MRSEGMLFLLGVGMLLVYALLSEQFNERYISDFWMGYFENRIAEIPQTEGIKVRL